MENEPNLFNYATTSRTAIASALGFKDATKKYVTGQRQQRQRLINLKKEIQVAGWNVRTGSHIGQKKIIARELSAYKISTAVVSEL